jgi:hypothetical protein
VRIRSWSRISGGAELSETVDAFLAELALHQYGWPESLRFTYDKTRELLATGVQGDLIECGVGAGVHPAAMARACFDHSELRTIHLLDSFEGVPHGGPQDKEWNEHWGDGSGRLEPSGVAACGIDDVRKNLVRWLGHDGEDDRARFVAYPGWFQDTLPVMAPTLGPIAFLRLDGDLYESTLVCLQHLYPLVASGGVIVVDDWNLDGCVRAVLDYMISEEHEWDSDDGAWAPVNPITASGDVWWTKP